DKSGHRRDRGIPSAHVSGLNREGVVMRALVLGGGSVKGAFQAGAIAEILRSGWYPDAIYGVSVGALNGAYVANKVGESRLSSGADIAGDDARAAWESIANDLESLWRHKITSFEVLGRKRGWLSLAWQIAWSNFDGLLKMDGLNKLVDRQIAPHNLRRSIVKYYAFSVNIANGELIKAGANDPDICQYILASTRIPIVMPIERVANQPLLDGGIRDVAPLKHAIDDGAKEIMAVLCHPKGVSGVSLEFGKLTELANRLMEIVVHEILTNDIDQARRVNEAVKAGTDQQHRVVKLIEIRPEKSLNIQIEKFTPAQIAEMLELGKATAQTAVSQSGI
ncbi:MAG: patatin-like phospholipase family protein, partial [Candidatus Eisenbacteria sp.]|nr:patatin-like phospholipase family protein [Candidatus Eisenbacteria bacterium]